MILLTANCRWVSLVTGPPEAGTGHDPLEWSTPLSLQAQVDALRKLCEHLHNRECKGFAWTAMGVLTVQDRKDAEFHGLDKQKEVNEMSKEHPWYKNQKNIAPNGSFVNTDVTWQSINRLITNPKDKCDINVMGILVRLHGSSKHFCEGVALHKPHLSLSLFLSECVLGA